MDWDYIVVDEASMIPVANIVYLLYKAHPTKFIIAGDPYQIAPIAAVNLWKDENIYTLVQLKSFVNPVTYPHKYDVKLLTRQYRSVPEIGGIYSRLSYGGILTHDRASDDRKPLNLELIDFESLNIIKYPVQEYESIYRAKRLDHGSAYQVYVSLFTFELVNFLAREIAKKYPGSQYKLGVIAPYRAEADLINMLVSSETYPSQVCIDVGTIHGYQGDECDIVIAAFTPPPKISKSRQMFLNQKNIINVAVSRAKDYLFVLMPDDKTENVNNLEIIKDLESYILATKSHKVYHSWELEQLMFGDPKYIENNAFSTSHQRVNIYRKPEMRYEVRTEDMAVDLHIDRGERKE